MRVELKKLLEQLGVNHVLSPYETFPWFYYDEEKAVTCSAEVRMGPGGDDIEAEIQLLKDSGEAEGEGAGGGQQQIMLMRAKPAMAGEWAPFDLKVKGESFVNKIYNWEGKGCNFFRACVQAMQMNQMPDIEELIEKELHDDDGAGGGRRGKIGRKSPKIKPAQLLGMKKM